MAKKIKFPLEMSGGIQVRTIEELREHFDLMKILGYYLDGKLLTWLNDRYYETEAAQISELNSGLPDFKARLCTILGVKNNFDNEINMEAVERRSAKVAKLKQYTDNEEIINKVDSVAFDQEELADLLDDDISPIYLCSGNFTIPINRENVTYIGINSVTINFNSTNLSDFERKKIRFENINLNKGDNKYKETFIEKINEIVEKYKKYRLEKEYLIAYSDYNIDTDYDGSYRFSSRSDAREAVKNRIERMHSDCVYYLNKKYGGYLSEKLGWKYAKQIISILANFKAEILSVYKNYNMHCPSLTICGTADESTMGRDNNGDYEGPCRIIVDFGDASERTEDLRNLMYNVRNGIDNTIYFSYRDHLIWKSQIKYDITKGFEEYCYYIETTELEDSLNKAVDALAQCVYEDIFIHRYFETLKESLFKDFEKQIITNESDSNEDPIIKCILGDWGIRV